MKAELVRLSIPRLTEVNGKANNAWSWDLINDYCIPRHHCHWHGQSAPTARTRFEWRVFPEPVVGHRTPVRPEVVATCRLAEGPHLGTRNWQLNGDKGSDFTKHTCPSLNQMGGICTAQPTKMARTSWRLTDDYSFPSRTAPTPFAKQHKISVGIRSVPKTDSN